MRTPIDLLCDLTRPFSPSGLTVRSIDHANTGWRLTGWERQEIADTIESLRINPRDWLPFHDCEVTHISGRLSIWVSNGVWGLVVVKGVGAKGLGHPAIWPYRKERREIMRLATRVPGFGDDWSRWIRRFKMETS